MVLGAPREGSVIALLVFHGDHVGDAGFVGRCVYGVDQSALGAGGRDIHPGVAAVAGEVHEAVVAADPDRVGVVRTLFDREDRVVHLDVLVGERA